MANSYEINVEEVEPMSRTYQYRKVMKPMLERKRRARINKCLDELKDLMVGALQNEGESITKLEKADVLELTVRHLRKLKHHNALAVPSRNHATEKFRDGFAQCATEVRRFVDAVPGIDLHVSGRLINHLGQWVGQLDSGCRASPPPQTVTPVASPHSVLTINMPRVYTPPSSPECKPLSPSSFLRQHVTPITPPQKMVSPVIVYPSSSNSPTAPACLLVPEAHHRVQPPAAVFVQCVQPMDTTADNYSLVKIAEPVQTPTAHTPTTQELDCKILPVEIKREITMPSNPMWRPW